MGGGDFETFVNLKQRGYQVCSVFVEIECRAQRFFNTFLQELGQKVECDLVRGFTCFNSEQSFSFCYNYELRVFCCDYVFCGIFSVSGISFGFFFSVIVQVLIFKFLFIFIWITLTREIFFQSIVVFISQIRFIVFVIIVQIGSSFSILVVIICQFKCQWIEWFDEDYFIFEKVGGDIESYDKIRSAGGVVCEQSQDIECEVENFFIVRLEELGQRVYCYFSFGLVCRN